MSADPITMFAITATKTLMDIRESKKQSKIEQARYEEKKKAQQSKKKQETGRAKTTSTGLRLGSQANTAGPNIAT